MSLWATALTFPILQFYNFIATKEQAFHTRYIKVHVDGKKDLNPECEMRGQNLGSISQIMSRCTQYSKDSSIKLWVSTEKNRQKGRMSTIGHIMK